MSVWVAVCKNYISNKFLNTVIWIGPGCLSTLDFLKFLRPDIQDACCLSVRATLVTGWPQSRAVYVYVHSLSDSIHVHFAIACHLCPLADLHPLQPQEPGASGLSREYVWLPAFREVQAAQTAGSGNDWMAPHATLLHLQDITFFSRGDSGFWRVLGVFQEQLSI